MAATIDELLARARQRLAEKDGPSRREAALLLGHVVGWSEARVMARGEEVVDARDARRFERLLERRLDGEPFAYLTGEREFYGRVFAVDDRVLIPRPETEHLVDTALELVAAGRVSKRPRILEIGTGSGCLAVTLALELDTIVVATDLSPAAAVVARANAARHGAGASVTLLAADLTGGVSLAGFDLVVSNPPYIEAHEVPEISPEILDHEPTRALFPPGGGRVFFTRFYAALSGLRPGVRVISEIGHRQGPLVAALLQATVFELDAIRPDYAGRDRVVVAHRR